MKGGVGSVMFFMVVVVVEFVDVCFRGLSGEFGIWVCVYVESKVTWVFFFVIKVFFG